MFFDAPPLARRLALQSWPSHSLPRCILAQTGMRLLQANSSPSASARMYHLRLTFKVLFKFLGLAFRCLRLWIAVDSLPPSLVSWWLVLLVLLSGSLEIGGVRRNTIQREGWLSTPSRGPRERGSLSGMASLPPRMQPITFFPCVGALTLWREIRVVPVWSSCASSFMNLVCVVYRDTGWSVVAVGYPCLRIEMRVSLLVLSTSMANKFLTLELRLRFRRRRRRRLRGTHPLPKKRHSPLAYLADPDCRW
jgi:hypothetical protein